MISSIYNSYASFDKCIVAKKVIIKNSFRGKIKMEYGFLILCNCLIYNEYKPFF